MALQVISAYIEAVVKSNNLVSYHISLDNSM